jgi:DNA modification methylase
MEQIMLTAALFKEFGFEVQVPTILHCDNNSAVSTYATEVAEWRTPTLATKYWHSRDHVDSGDIKVVYIDTKSNNADVHTKWLPNQDHLRHAHWLGLRPPSGSSGT